jgi:hypothetical protein
MIQEEHKLEISLKKEIKPKYMMGTKAHHLLGDISSDNFDLKIISVETEKYWIGSWVTGFGFFNVCFPKETTRELTSEEVEKYNKTYVRIGSQPSIKLKVN